VGCIIAASLVARERLPGGSRVMLCAEAEVRWYITHATYALVRACGRAVLMFL